jgi:glycyl-tRNA synthetase beta chain
LRAIRKSKNFEPLTVSFKRVRKILEKAATPSGEVQRVSPELFENDAERGLHAAMIGAASGVKEHKRLWHFREALEAIAAMRPEIDKFFEQVMVMAENESVRKNRLALLAELLREFTTIADFSEIGGEVRA